MSGPRAGLDLEETEIHLLLEGIYRRYGLEFRDYALPFVHRAIGGALQEERLATVSALQERVLRDPECLERLLRALTRKPRFFAAPGFYSGFRTGILPLLRTYPSVRLWHAACSSGEEVYSMTILLEEEGFLDRCQLYATEATEAGLRQAEAGIFDPGVLSEGAAGYRDAGGRRSLSDYYELRDGGARLHDSLRNRILFAQHNLATDGSFNEFNLIVCREVFAMFNLRLAARVRRLCRESLCMFGILATEPFETPDPLLEEEGFQGVDGSGGFYRRTR